MLNYSVAKDSQVFSVDYCRLNTVFVKMDECRREGNMLPTADGEYRLSSNVYKNVKC